MEQHLSIWYIPSVPGGSPPAQHSWSPLSHHDRCNKGILADLDCLPELRKGHVPHQQGSVPLKIEIAYHQVGTAKLVGGYWILSEIYPQLLFYGLPTEFLRRKKVRPLPSIQKEEDAFQKLKDALIQGAILSTTVPRAPFILQMDASAIGLGAVLSMEQNDLVPQLLSCPGLNNTTWWQNEA